ncbi:DUF982 domain-containing protein [Mesorhizobium sp. LNJC403B00]|uniref:DUF982 domain-containing protein n=2 Tax=Mesorhizobium TaxID=68287 RepID=UPI0032AFECD6
MRRNEDDHCRTYWRASVARPQLAWTAQTMKLNGSFDLEDHMNDRMFDSAVFVKSGDNLVQEITCLEDALEFLYEWPKDRRGPIHQTALRACQRAFDSDYPLSAARDAFSGFAKAARILEEASTTMPWMMGRGGEGGGVTA